MHESVFPVTDHDLLVSNEDFRPEVVGLGVVFRVLGDVAPRIHIAIRTFVTCGQDQRVRRHIGDDFVVLAFDTNVREEVLTFLPEFVDDPFDPKEAITGAAASVPVSS